MGGTKSGGKSRGSSENFRYIAKFSLFLQIFAIFVNFFKYKIINNKKFLFFYLFF